MIDEGEVRLGVVVEAGKFLVAGVAKGKKKREENLSVFFESFSESRNFC